jgi:hypothetical protein
MYTENEYYYCNVKWMRYWTDRTARANDNRQTVFDTIEGYTNRNEEGDIDTDTIQNNSET